MRLKKCAIDLCDFRHRMQSWSLTGVILHGKRKKKKKRKWTLENDEKKLHSKNTYTILICESFTSTSFFLFRFWAYPYFFKHIIAQQLDFDVRDTARTVLVHYPTLTNTSKLDRMVEFERKRKKSLDELRCIDEALMRNTQLQNVKEIDEKIHECSNERRVVDYLA